MKKLFVLSAAIALMGLTATSYAQETKKNEESTVKRVGKKIKKGAKKAGNKTAELATKGKGKLTDKTSEEWVGPDGQIIYIDDDSKYYWVDEKGARRWVTKNQLKPKLKKEEDQ
ncbi:MAG TPA: hypothetical protein VFQ73_17030 [Flavisolibacter sp.]|nr:hypothetical protein [Flavisolibacter sp.]